MGRNSLVGETPRRDSCLGVTSLLQIPIHQKNTLLLHFNYLYIEAMVFKVLPSFLHFSRVMTPLALDLGPQSGERGTAERYEWLRFIPADDCRKITFQGWEFFV